MERKTYTLNGKQFTWHSVDVDYGDAWEDEQGNVLEPEAVTWRVLQAMNVSVEETGKIDKDYILDMLQDDADEILNDLQHLAHNEIGMTEEEARAYQAWKEALVAKDAYSITSADKERMAAAQDAYYAAYNESCARPEVQQRHQELLADEVGPYAVTLKAIEVIRDAHMEYLPEHDAEKNNIDQESNPQTGKATCVPTPTPFKSGLGTTEWALTITTAKGKQYRDVGATLGLDEKKAVTAAKALERGDANTLEQYGIALDDDDLWEVRRVVVDGVRYDWRAAHNGVILSHSSNEYGEFADRYASQITRPGEALIFVYRENASAWLEELRGRANWDRMSYGTRLRVLQHINPGSSKELQERDARKPAIDLNIPTARMIGKASAALLREPAPAPNERSEQIAAAKHEIEKNIESNMAIARARQQEKIAKDARDQDAKNLALLNNIAQRQIQLKKRELGLVINRTNPLQENPAEGDSPVLFDGRTVASADLRDLESIQGNNMRLLAAEMILDNARRSHSYEADMRVTESGGPETLLARAKAWHETTAKPVLKGKNNTRLYRGNGGDHLIGRIGDDFVVVYSVARAAKPNFLRVEKPEMVSSSGGQLFWKEIGYGNAINRTANRTPVFFDTLAFDTQSTGITYARIPKSVSIDEDLHYNLGFLEARVPRPEPADKNEVADAPKPEDTDTQKARASALPRMEM